MKEVDIQPLIDAASSYIYFSMVMKVIEPFLVIGTLFALGYGVWTVFKLTIRGVK